MNVTLLLFGNRGFSDVIKLRSFWVRIGTSLWLAYLKEEGHLDTGGIPCHDESRDLSDAAESQQMPIIDSNHQTLGEMYEIDSLSETPERSTFSNTLTSYFKTPVCERINSVVLSHVVCGILLQ